MPSRQPEGKQKVDPEEEKDKHHKALHIMFGGSWHITYWCIVKTLRLEVVTTAPAPRLPPHRKWLETSISFDAFDYPKSMVGIEKLSLLISLTITNIKLYHVLIDGGATLNLISLQLLRSYRS
jgi:hypothetical protein